MAERRTMARARRARRRGKSPTTQAGEFVREEFHHIRHGRHGARSTRQAIAIGLSKARRAGVDVGAPRRASSKTRAQAARERREGRTRHSTSPTRSRAVEGALRREGRRAGSHESIARHSRTVARMRGRSARHRSAEKAVRTKGPAGLHRAAQKAARTRERHRSLGRRSR
ncbi:MAG TPA: DNA-binding protein [Bacteroidota bacterium]